MRGSTIKRIVMEDLSGRSVRSNLRRIWTTASDSCRVFRFSDPGLTRHVLKDHIRFIFDTVRPVHGQTSDRLRAAVEWILRAQAATETGGVSYSYSPGDGKNGWRPPYPETTGYIITSLFEYSERFGDEHVRQRALDMAYWEMDVQMASGAVQAGILCAASQQTPAAFNTGMVLDGWSTAYRLTNDKLICEAGRRAADFLVSDLDSDGYFTSQGRVVAHRVKTFNCLCAWSLYRFGQIVEDSAYLNAAVRVIEAALNQQQPNGWFANNCLTRHEAPLLHTIGYTLQAILEVGILAQREDFVEAAKRGADPLLSRISSKGFLHGRFYSDWEPASFSSCLTGSAQLAVVYYRLYEHTGVRQYYTKAECLVNYLKALQVLDSPLQKINGALAGSFPFFGQYMAGSYPNWATKYFIDSLMLQHQLEGNSKIST